MAECFYTQMLTADAFTKHCVIPAPGNRISDHNVKFQY